MYGQPRRLVIHMSQSSNPFRVKGNELNFVLSGLRWGGDTPVQEELMRQVRSTVSDSLIRQIGSMCSVENNLEQVIGILYYELLFNLAPRAFDLTAYDVNSMCTWDHSGLGRGFWEYIHMHGRTR
jgi:hypothetical protein